MAALHKLAAGAALAAIATFGFATAANAAVDDQKRWYVVEDNGSLVEISDNNVGPFQVCHNNVPVNVVGGQVPVSDIIGVLGIDSDGNTATQVHNCDQGTVQNNDMNKHWYRVDDDGALIEISDNNVGPFQACDNNVPVNVVGGQVPIDDVTGILGIGSDDNTATLIESCEQNTEQNNDGPPPTEPGTPTPSESTPTDPGTPPSESTPEPSNPTSSNDAPKPTPVETNAPVAG